MKTTILALAVAALAAAAMSFPAYGYCRGCVIEPSQKATLVANADASVPVSARRCRMEKQRYWRNGTRRWRRVEVCD